MVCSVILPSQEVAKVLAAHQLPELSELIHNWRFFTVWIGHPVLPYFALLPGVEPTSALVEWFWEVMEEFSTTERSLFLRFVWGRTRLPRSIADFRGRDFVLQVRSFRCLDLKLFWTVGNTDFVKIQISISRNLQANLLFLRSKK